MHRFKNNVSDGWLFAQEIRLFNNFARNWSGEVADCKSKSEIQVAMRSGSRERQHEAVFDDLVDQ